MNVEHNLQYVITELTLFLYLRKLSLFGQIILFKFIPLKSTDSFLPYLILFLSHD